jgi:hypothetical protein
MIKLFLLFYGVPAPETEETLFRDFFSAGLTGDGRDPFTAMGAFHLFLLCMEILDESFDISLVPIYLVNEFPRPFVRKEAIQVIALPGKQGVKVHFPCPLFFSHFFRRFLVFLFHIHQAPYKIALFSYKINPFDSPV